MKCFSTDELFQADNGVSISASMPCVVKSEALQALFSENPVKFAIAMYKINVQSQCGPNGREQMPMLCGRKKRTQEVLASYVQGHNAMEMIIFDGAMNDVMAPLTFVSCWQTMKHVDCERTGLPNLRYQCEGKRQVLAASFDTIQQLAEATNIVLSDDQDITEFMPHVLELATNLHLADESLKQGFF